MNATMKYAVETMKAQMERHDRETYHRGFTIEELKGAFDVICPRDNWKNPINAQVCPENAALYVTAIEFMVGGKCGVAYRDGCAFIRNAGYYANIGA